MIMVTQKKVLQIISTNMQPNISLKTTNTINIHRSLVHKAKYISILTRLYTEYPGV